MITTEHTNFILKTDSYKLTHAPQYPKGIRRVHSFFESRGGEYPEVLFFGLQYILQKHLAGPVITKDDIDEAEEVATLHFGNRNYFNRAGWERILYKHDGCLPLRVRAVPEGTVVPNHNCLMTIENTDDEPEQMHWLTNSVETILSQVWYPCTVATQGRAIRQRILRSLELTGDPRLVDFMQHDFGFRGSTSVESAGIGGTAHLVNFKGTDTLEALMVARKFYSEPMAGFSVPASEHSTMTSWGRDHEADTYLNMLRLFPAGPVSVVSDSYNIFRACEEIWGTTLKSEVLKRDGVLVIRPDSGDPLVVLPQLFEILGRQFGYTVNSKGYRVLNPKVRIIQGDGIDLKMVDLILTWMENNGWSADNIIFGSGGALLQKMNRDTLKFALKCSAVQIGDSWIPVSKDPVTDLGKRSKAGLLELVRDDQGWYTVTRDQLAARGLHSELQTVFENGELTNRQTLSQIRARAA